MLIRAITLVSVLTVCSCGDETLKPCYYRLSSKGRTVCGSDKTTYPNICEFERAKSKNSHLAILYNGPCKKSNKLYSSELESTDPSCPGCNSETPQNILKLHQAPYGKCRGNNCRIKQKAKEPNQASKKRTTKRVRTTKKRQCKGCPTTHPTKGPKRKPKRKTTKRPDRKRKTTSKPQSPENWCPCEPSDSTTPSESPKSEKTSHSSESTKTSKSSESTPSSESASSSKDCTTSKTLITSVVCDDSKTSLTNKKNKKNKKRWAKNNGSISKTKRGYRVCTSKSCKNVPPNKVHTTIDENGCRKTTYWDETTTCDGSKNRININTNTNDINIINN